MGRNYLLGILSASILLASALVGCQGESSVTPQVDHSPLASPIETPTVAQSPAQTPTPSRCADGCLNPSEDCLIKGVVTGMGDRYYYLPDMEGYQDALLLVQYGGRWFCTEEEATRNGFQKAPEPEGS